MSDMTREEAKTALGDRNNLLWGMSKEEQKYYSEALDMAISALSENKGEWISHYDEDAKEGWYECSCCHSERAFNTNFCPDCGADMREPKPKLGNSMLVGKPSLLNQIPIGEKGE